MYSSGSATYLKSIALITDNPVSPGSMFIGSVKIYKLGEAVFTVVASRVHHGSILPVVWL
jgi:hypothetical protein